MFQKDYYAHSSPEFFDRFWNIVDKSGYGDRIAAIPGNHDVPLQYFLESDDRGPSSFQTDLRPCDRPHGQHRRSRRCKRSGYGWTTGYARTRIYSG